MSAILFFFLISTICRTQLGHCRYDCANFAVHVLRIDLHIRNGDFRSDSRSQWTTNESRKYHCRFLHNRRTDAGQFNFAMLQFVSSTIFGAQRISGHIRNVRYCHGNASRFSVSRDYNVSTFLDFRRFCILLSFVGKIKLYAFLDILQHTERTYHSLDGAVRKQESGYFMLGMDRHQNALVLDGGFVPELVEAQHTRDECHELFCGLPLYTSRMFQLM